MKVIILCGGSGIRLKNSLQTVPKGIVKIGHRPLLWHIMKIYANFGVDEFVLALGSKGELIRDYFIHYNEIVNDLTIILGKRDLNFNSGHQENNWKITFVETGEDSGTGARIARCKKYVEGEEFAVAYSDCLADVNITKLLEYHRSQKKIATVTGVTPPYRYGEFVMDGTTPVGYRDTSRVKSIDGLVNGGFMVFSPKVFNYLDSFSECVLEKTIFSNLVKDREICVYEHGGFWQCLDNDREHKFLNDLCATNSEFWFKAN